MSDAALYEIQPEDLLLVPSDPTWASVAADDLTATLADHAHCEKKAAASAISLINHYPDDTELVLKCTALAKEELDHFREIYQLLESLDKSLPYDKGDPYVKALLQHVRQAPDQRKLDRLLISALIEARSCERFRLLSEELADRGDQMNAKRFSRLQHSEAGHAALFVGLARRPNRELANERLRQLQEAEAEIVKLLPIVARIH